MQKRHSLGDSKFFNEISTNGTSPQVNNFKQNLELICIMNNIPTLFSSFFFVSTTRRVGYCVETVMQTGLLVFRVPLHVLLGGTLTFEVLGTEPRRRRPLSIVFTAKASGCLHLYLLFLCSEIRETR